MKVLVTGGAGFMGSNFVKYILNKYPDYEVINLDKLTYAGNLENLKEVENNTRYRFIKGDIADEKVVDKLVNEVDVLINFAAETHVDRSILNPKDFVVTDVIGTHTLLEAVKKYGKKLIQISTDEVYGSTEKGDFTEESPLEPNSPYSASKAGGDLLCRSYVKTFNTAVILIRSCNFYGPNQYPEKVIPLFITNLLEGKKVPLYGDGLNVREWIYTQDYCEGLDLVLHQGKTGEIYNISSEEEITNLDLTKIILQELGKNEEFIEYVKDRPGHDRRYSVDSSKLRKELGWEPKFKFAEGIKRTIEWYKNNESWWKPLKSGEYLKYYREQYGKS